MIMHAVERIVFSGFEPTAKPMPRETDVQGQGSSGNGGVPVLCVPLHNFIHPICVRNTFCMCLLLLLVSFCYICAHSFFDGWHFFSFVRASKIFTFTVFVTPKIASKTSPESRPAKLKADCQPSSLLALFLFPNVAPFCGPHSGLRVREGSFTRIECMQRRNTTIYTCFFTRHTRVKALCTSLYRYKPIVSSRKGAQERLIVTGCFVSHCVVLRCSVRTTFCSRNIAVVMFASYQWELDTSIDVEPPAASSQSCLEHACLSALRAENKHADFMWCV